MKHHRTAKKRGLPQDAENIILVVYACLAAFVIVIAVFH